MTNGKAGAGSTASRPSPVDGDRLWCDRIRNETVSAKNWNETYEYLINRNLQSDSERQADLERQLGASGFCYSGMKSESQSSYGSRPPLERGSERGLRSTCSKFK